MYLSLLPSIREREPGRKPGKTRDPVTFRNSDLRQRYRCHTHGEDALSGGCPR